MDVVSYLLGQKAALDKLEKEQEIHNENIKKAGKALLVELQKISGWKCMMLHCQDHYEKYPDEFFDWCEYTIEDGYLLVTKHYSWDPDGFVVLRLDLSVPLEEQVKIRMKKDAESHDKELIAQYEYDMKTLDSLHIPRIDFEEWKKRNNEN